MNNIDDIYHKKDELVAKAREVFDNYHRTLSYGYFTAKKLGASYCDRMGSIEKPRYWDLVKFYLTSTSYGE